MSKHDCGGRCAATDYNRGCRCDGCKETNRLRARKQREARKSAPRDEQGHVIGQPYSPSTYANWFCRCPKCTELHSERCRINDIKAGRQKGSLEAPEESLEGPEESLEGPKPLEALEALEALGRIVAA